MRWIIGPVAVLDVIVPELAPLPGVVAVVLGGSRARGTNRPDSDWDIGLYYRGDVALTAGTMARATAQTAHGVLAERGEWVLNEKGIVDAAGLGEAHEIIGRCADDPEGAVRRRGTLLAPPALDELKTRTDST